MAWSEVPVELIDKIGVVPDEMLPDRTFQGRRGVPSLERCHAFLVCDDRDREVEDGWLEEAFGHVDPLAVDHHRIAGSKGFLKGPVFRCDEVVFGNLVAADGFRRIPDIEPGVQISEQFHSVSERDDVEQALRCRRINSVVILVLLGS